MPYSINPTTNTTVYTSGEFFSGKVLSADQTVTNSATLVTVPQFTLGVGKYERVLFRMNIFYTTTLAGDLKYRVDVPASPTLYRMVPELIVPAATAVTTPGLITAEADGTGLSASGTDGWLRITGMLNNGANAGDVIFQFAQNTATAAESAVIRAGSFIEFMQF
jgi:hypothetical protein